MTGTPKGEATRRRILEAAWALSEQKGAEALLGGVTLRELAAAVDLTPSAISYHFPTMRELGLAMVRYLDDDDSAIPIEVVDELLRSACDDGLAAAAHAAASMNWAAVTSPGQVKLEQRILRSIAIAPDDEVARPLVKEILERWTASLGGIYARTLEVSDRQLVEPFELVEVTEVIEAIAEGLLHRWMVDKERIRPDLAADMIVGLLTVITTPKQSPTALGELSAGLDPDRFRTDGSESELAERAASMFHDGFEDVTLTQIAVHLGIDLADLTPWAVTVRHLAARSFARHVPQITLAFGRRQEKGPEVVLTDGVYELARCTSADPHCALALLHERQSAAMNSPARELDMRLLVPLGALFEDAVGDLTDLPGDAAVADLLIDTVLGQGATRQRTPPAELTSLALRFLPGF